MEAVKRIKVLRIINRFNLGGPTYNVTYLTAYLPANFETRLLGGAAEKSEGDALFIPHQHHLEPEIIPDLQRAVNFKKDRKAYQKIKKIIAEYQPDIVHTHASKAGAIGRLAAFKSKVPVVVHTFHGHVFHSYFGRLKTSFYKAVERYLAKKSTAIIAISNKQKEELVHIHKIAKADKVRVVNLGFDLNRFQDDLERKREEFSSQYSIAQDEICIGIIGRLTAVKNHQLFFDIIGKTFKKTSKKVHVFVIGDGELRDELKIQANEVLQMSKDCKITFTSWIKDVSVPLARLDIVCLTSFNEGTPVSLIEAQAANVAVISTRVGGVEDIIDENRTGFIVDGLSSDEYAQKLLHLVENKNELERIQGAGWDFVKEKFHYKTLCFNIEQLYLELLNL